MPRGSLYKLLELLNFPKENHSAKNFENSASKIKCNGIHGEKVEKINPLFWNFRKMLFHSGNSRLEIHAEFLDLVESTLDQSAFIQPTPLGRR